MFGDPALVDPKDPTAVNRRAVLRSILGRPHVSRVEIAKDTGLAPASVYRLSRVLMEQGLVVEAGVDVDTGGRPSQLLRFNPDSHHVLAADVTPAVINFAVFNLHGEIAYRDSAHVAGLAPLQVADRLVGEIAKRLERGVHWRFAAVGVSIPGPVTDEGIVTVAPSIGWRNLPLGSMLRAVTDVPVTVENDMNLFAFAEWSKAKPDAEGPLAVFGVYAGIGIGIVENGRIWRGAGGASGQVGRMYMDAQSFMEKAGEYREFGQTESLLGGNAILEGGRSLGLVAPDSTELDAPFGGAMAGDEGSLKYVDKLLSGYAFQIANLLAILAPRTVVMAGLFNEWADLVIPILEDKLEGRVLEPPALVSSELGEDAKLIGAGLFALERRGGILSLT